MYIGARIGIEQGWSHIYSLDLQHQLFDQLRGGAPFGDGERFLSPPPLAWLVLPLTTVGLAAGFWIWLALLVAALVAAWWLAAPGRGWTRWLWLLGALAWYPLLYSLALGQPVVLVLLAVTAGWWLAESNRPYLAGAALAGIVFKPQIAIAVPAVLLLAGRWRIAGSWALLTAILAGVSLLIIGSQGLSDYRSLLAEAQHVVNNRYFTLAFILGPGPWGYAAQFLVTVVGLIGAYVNRRAGMSRLLALGLVASSLGATYWHLQDFAVLIGAAWLFYRDHPPAWQQAWLLVVAGTAELAWPLGPLPVLIAVAVWFGILVVPAQETSRRQLELPAR